MFDKKKVFVSVEPRNFIWPTCILKTV